MFCWIVEHQCSSASLSCPETHDHKPRLDVQETQLPRCTVSILQTAHPQAACTFSTFVHFCVCFKNASYQKYICQRAEFAEKSVWSSVWCLGVWMLSLSYSKEENRTWLPAQVLFDMQAKCTWICHMHFSFTGGVTDVQPEMSVAAGWSVCMSARHMWCGSESRQRTSGLSRMTPEE